MSQWITRMMKQPERPWRRSPSHLARSARKV
jgi:hypothetical protein